jgi:hypothetical protein
VPPLPVLPPLLVLMESVKGAGHGAEKRKQSQ